MKINDAGLRLIKNFEGFRNRPYRLPGEQYYTVGWGHYGADVQYDRVYTIEQCNEFLQKDIERFEKNVNKYVAVYDLNENQFSALVSFAYNIGSIDGLTNYGKRSIAEIKAKIPQYCRDSLGHILEGLHRRRLAELELFNTPVSDDSDKWLYDSIAELNID